MCGRKHNFPEPDMVSVPRSFVATVTEFISDWRKGDFQLEGLAAIDAAALEQSLKTIGAPPL